MFLGRGEVCNVQEDVDYVDDINAVVEDPGDLLVVDELFIKFEEMSGAILNRTLA